MSKHSEDLVLEVDVGQAVEICREAIAGLGWRVMKDEAGQLTVKEVTPTGMSFTNAAKVEVLVGKVQRGTGVRLNGSITGMGPIQKGHLKGQLGALKNQIVVAAKASAPDSPHRGGASVELERLGRLHQEGLLTDGEFVQAKQLTLGA